MKDEIKAGRPKTDPTNHKRNRAISLTDNEYNELKKQASKINIGVSAFIIKKLKLKKDGF